MNGETEKIVTVVAVVLLAVLAIAIIRKDDHKKKPTLKSSGGCPSNKPKMMAAAPMRASQQMVGDSRMDAATMMDMNGLGSSYDVSLQAGQYSQPMMNGRMLNNNPPDAAGLTPSGTQWTVDTNSELSNYSLATEMYQPMSTNPNQLSAVRSSPSPPVFTKQAGNAFIGPLAGNNYLAADAPARNTSVYQACDGTCSATDPSGARNCAMCLQKMRMTGMMM